MRITEGRVGKRDMPPGYIEHELAAAGKMVHDLLAHGADVAVTDIDGRTLLMMAIMHRALPAAWFLRSQFP